MMILILQELLQVGVSDKLTRWMRFYEERYVRTYVYVVLTSKAKVRSSTVSNPESKLGDQ